MFETYFELGYSHILDFEGYDHLLFLVALCAVYTVYEFKQILILVTAFTIGHSLTLLIAGLDLVNISSAWIEFLIPVTIFLTALSNIIIEHHDGRDQRLKYGMALIFGLIHGLGFSNYFKSLLMKEENIISLLFPFNLGVEVGQIVIVMVIMAISFVFLQLLSVKQEKWNTFVSGAAAGIALILVFETWPM